MNPHISIVRACRVYRLQPSKVTKKPFRHELYVLVHTFTKEGIFQKSPLWNYRCTLGRDFIVVLETCSL